MASTRKLFVELGVNSRKLSAGLRKSEGKFKRFGKKVSRGIKKSFSGLSLAAGGGVALGLASAAGDVKEFEQVLEDLRVQSERTVGGVGNVRDQINGLAAIGVDRNELVGGVAELVDLMGADELNGKNINTMGRAMAASGAQSKDLARVMLGLRESFELDPSQYEEALSIMLSIGKQGSIPLSEMAQIFAGSAASFTQAGGMKGLEGLKQMTAALQVAKPAFGGAAEGATGLEAVMGTLQSRHKEIKKYLKIDVFDKVKGADGKSKFVARSPSDVLEDMANSEKLQNDPRLIMKALGRKKEARKMLQTYMAKRDQMKDLEGKANTSQIERDVQDRQSSPIGKMNRSYAKLKVSLAKAFTPERIEKFAEAIEKLADLMAVMVDNLKAMVALWAAAKFGPGMAGMAMQGAGALGGTGIGNNINNMSKSGGVGKLGAAGLVVSAGLLGYEFGKLLDETFHLSDGISNAAISIFGAAGRIARAADSNRLGTLEEKFDKGEITADELRAGKQNLAEIFSYRGTAALTDEVGAGIIKSGVGKEDLQARYNALGDKSQDEIREMARQILVDSSKGNDTTALVDKMASAIAGAPIHISLSGESIKNVLDKSIDTRVAP